MMSVETLKKGWEFQQERIRQGRDPEEVRSTAENYLQLVMAGAPIRDIALLVHHTEKKYKSIIELHNSIFKTQGVGLNLDAILRSIEGKHVHRLLLDELLSLKAADLIRRIAKVRSG